MEWGRGGKFGTDTDGTIRTRLFRRTGFKRLCTVLRALFSRDHKTVAVLYLGSALFFLLLGGLLALVMRWQLGFPGSPVPFWLLKDIFPSAVIDGGVVQPQGYNALFTMHATFMMFFAVVPVMIGFFGHYLVPLQIGARRLAWPLAGPLSFALFLLSGLVMIASFFVEGGAAATGWTAYPPLSGREGYTGVGAGQDLWIIALLIYGLSLVLICGNLCVTIVNMRAPGMRMTRLPLTVWSVLITTILALLSVPVLASGLLLLLSDRLLDTSFFLPAGLKMSGMALEGTGGGDPLLWQHLFWFFGHPVVYIMILPGMGVISDILPVFSRKPVFGYRAMILSTCAIAFLGMIVWGHHMFQTGLNPLLRSGFMLATMVIAVPSGVKVFNWIGTLWGGRLRFGTPMLFALGFVLMFVVGGLSGVFMASTPVDMYIHDSYFIVGHIHYVLFGGSLFAIFAGIYYWYPKITGRMADERLGKIHFWLTLITFNGVFFPMHILGMGGHMRRIFDPTVYDYLAELQPVNVFITVSAIGLGGAQLLLLYNLVRSRKKGELAGGNPWRSNTLEWSIPSPAPAENFAVLPTVSRGPYEYSSPEGIAGEDYLPQHR